MHVWQDCWQQGADIQGMFQYCQPFITDCTTVLPALLAQGWCLYWTHLYPSPGHASPLVVVVRVKHDLVSNQTIHFWCKDINVWPDQTLSGWHLIFGHLQFKCNWIADISWYLAWSHDWLVCWPIIMTRWEGSKPSDSSFQLHLD